MDRGGTFLGVLRVPGAPSGGLNLGMALLQAGLAKLHPSFDAGRVTGGREMAGAEAQAREARLKVCAGEPVKSLCQVHGTALAGMVVKCMSCSRSR